MLMDQQGAMKELTGMEYEIGLMQQSGWIVFNPEFGPWGLFFNMKCEDQLEVLGEL